MIRAVNPILVKNDLSDIVVEMTEKPLYRGPPGQAVKESCPRVLDNTKIEVFEGPRPVIYVK